MWRNSIDPFRVTGTQKENDMKESVKSRSIENITVGADVSEEVVGKTVIYAVGVVGALIGLWGISCIVAGIIQSGGPLSFVGNWFRAVTGI